MTRRAVKPFVNEDPIAYARIVVDQFLEYDEHRLDSGTPLVAIFGDLHHVDSASLASLRYAIPRLAKRGFIFVFGFNTVVDSELARYAVELESRLSDVVRLTLSPLGEEDVQATFQERYGATLAGPAATSIVQRTSGLPGAVDDLLLHLFEEDLQEVRLTGYPPGNVFDRVDRREQARFDSLSPQAKNMAKIAALAGQPLSTETMRGIAEGMGWEFDLNEILAEEFVTHLPGDNSIAPIRTWLRAIVERDAEEEEVRALHRLLAGINHEGRLAHEVGAMGDELKGEIAKLREDVRGLEQAGRLHEASEALRVASDQTRDRETLERLVFERVNLHRRQLLPFGDASIFEALKRLPSESIMRRYGELTIKLLSPIVGKDDFEAILAFIQEPSESDDDKSLRAETAFSAILPAATLRASLVLPIFSRARELYAELTEDTGRDLRVSRAARTVLLDAVELFFRDPTSEDFAQQLELTVRCAQQLTLTDSDRADALAICAHFLLMRGQVLQAAVLADDVIETAAKLFVPAELIGQAVLVRATCDFRMGNWTRALERTDELQRTLLQGRDSWKRVAVPALLSVVESAMGNRDAAVSYLEQARAAERALPLALWIDDFLPSAECELALHDGDFERIVQVTTEWENSVVTGASISTLLRRHHALLSLGRLEEAQEVIDRIDSMNASFDGGYAAVVAVYKGRQALAVGDRATARRCFLKGLDAAIAPTDEARCLTGLAELELDDPTSSASDDEIAAYLDQADARLDSIQAEGYRLRSQRLRQQLQGRAKSRLRQLTDREQEVAELAAAGLTNVEIAARMHISRSTVAFHMSKALHKLEVKSRRDIARVLPQPHKSDVAGDDGTEGGQPSTHSR